MWARWKVKKELFIEPEAEKVAWKFMQRLRQTYVLRIEKT